MKRSHLNLLLSVSVILTGLAGAGMMTSCNRNDVIPPDPGRTGNYLIYNGGERIPIESVIYTIDAERTYTAYFSPTKGLTTLGAMELADDYLKIATKTPTGSIDLRSGENTLTYGEMSVTSENTDAVTASELTLNLPSQTSLEMSLLATIDGNTIEANFNGQVRRISTITSDDLLLDKQIFFYYMGDPTNAGSNDYYLAVTNLEEWSGTIGQDFTSSSKGYILTLDFYGKKSAEYRLFPTGEFTESDSHAPQTYYSASTYSDVTYSDGEGNLEEMQLTGEPVTITDNQDGTYTITAYFYDMNDDRRTITYTGELNIIDGTTSITNPQLYEDVEFDGISSKDRPNGSGTGVYSGDLLGTGTGMMEVQMYDYAGANDQPNGSAIRLMFFTKTFNDDDDIYIEDGTYTVSTTYERGTFLPCAELNIMGGILPYGTYLMKEVDGSAVYAYASGGSFTVERWGDYEYTITFDLVTVTGHKITGAYSGQIVIENQAEDDGNDGTSNLETEVELDLSYLPTASCEPRSQIYLGGLGMRPVTDIWQGDFTPLGKPCSYQVIDIGKGSGYFAEDPMYPETGKLKTGDIFRIDLLVEEGKDNVITPGTYKVTTTRYPQEMEPGVCLQGYAGTGGNDGTRYSKVSEALGNGYPDGLDDKYKYFDVFGNPVAEMNGVWNPYFQVNGPLNRASQELFACVYSGSITITKATAPAGEKDEGNWYTFDIDCKDVTLHDITGTWTGPVYLNGDTSRPALPNEGGDAAGGDDSQNGTSSVLRQHPFTKDLGVDIKSIGISFPAPGFLRR